MNKPTYTIKPLYLGEMTRYEKSMHTFTFDYGVKMHSPYLAFLVQGDGKNILVDTGPSLGSLTINALTAADEIIIPIDPELFALVGLKELTETISKIKQKLNPKVEIIGILFTKCSKRTTLYRQTSEQVRSVFSHLPIFESQIPATVQVGTANSKGLSVMELDAKSPAAAAYMNLAKEVLAYA